MLLLNLTTVRHFFVQPHHIFKVCDHEASKSAKMDTDENLITNFTLIVNANKRIPLLFNEFVYTEDPRYNDTVCYQRFCC